MAKARFAMQLLQMTGMPNFNILGLGIPQRTPSYIGVSKKWLDEEDYKRNKNN